MTLLGIALSLIASFAVVMGPRGFNPAMPEFWSALLLYGAPVIALAWPLYLPIFRRLVRYGWWLPSLIGFLLSPIPFLLLVIAGDALKGQLLVGHPSSYYTPWKSVFTLWYAVFGAILGAWVAWASTLQRSTAPTKAAND